jgi:hypothetical protein
LSAAGKTAKASVCSCCSGQRSQSHKHRTSQTHQVLWTRASHEVPGMAIAAVLMALASFRSCSKTKPCLACESCSGTHMLLGDQFVCSMS